MISSSQGIQGINWCRIDYSELLSAIEKKAKDSPPLDERDSVYQKIGEIKKICDTKYRIESQFGIYHDQQFIYDKEIISHLTPEIIIQLSKEKDLEKPSMPYHSFARMLLSHLDLALPYLKYHQLETKPHDPEHKKTDKNRVPPVSRNIINAAKQIGIDPQLFIDPIGDLTLRDQLTHIKKVMDSNKETEFFRSEELEYARSQFDYQTQRIENDIFFPRSTGTKAEASLKGKDKASTLLFYIENMSEGMRNIETTCLMVCLADTQNVRIGDHDFLKSDILFALADHDDKNKMSNESPFNKFSDSLMGVRKLLKNEFPAQYGKVKLPSIKSAPVTATTPTTVTPVAPTRATPKTSAKEKESKPNNKTAKYISAGVISVAAIAGGIAALAGATLTLTLCTAGGAAALFLLACLAKYAIHRYRATSSSTLFSSTTPPIDSTADSSSGLALSSLTPAPKK